jgi:acyl carrier protein
MRDHKKLFSEEPEIEEQLVEMWKEVLKKPAVEKDISFQKQGGQSLHAVVLASKVKEHFDTGIDLATILDGLTIHKLAYIIRNSEESFYAKHIEEISKTHYDLSYSQYGIYVASQTEADSLTYNISSVHSVKGNIDIQVLQTVFYILISRHESLRSVFKEIGGKPYQIIYEPEDIEFSIQAEPLNGCTIHSQEVEKAIRKEATTPFDLESKPLFRVRLLTLQPDHSLILFNIHHIICDGISLKILATEAFQLYNSFLEDQPMGMVPFRVQYKDFSEWQRSIISSHFDEFREFWLSELYASKKLDMRVLHGSSDQEEINFFNGERVSLELDSDICERLKTISRQANATLYTLCTASLNLLLHYYSGAVDIITGTVLAGRVHTELNDQVGMYVNTLPVRLKIEPNQPFEDLLLAVRKKLINVSKYQVYPLSNIIQDLGINRSNSNPLFDVVIQMIEFESPLEKSINNGPIEVNYIEFDHIRSKFDLVFNIYFIADESKLGFDIIYNIEKFGHDNIKKLKTKYLAIIKNITDDPISSCMQICIDEPEYNSINSIFED